MARLAARSAAVPAAPTVIAPRAWRLLLLAGILPGLAPGTFIRSKPPPPNLAQTLIVEKLATTSRQFGEFRFLEAWRLSSPYSEFGSYSALVALGNGRLLAFSDTGDMFEFSEPGAALQVPPRLAIVGNRGRPGKWQADAEAATRDPATGRIWLAYEGSNFITRFNSELRREGFAYPNEMRRWGSNSGPEAMVRLRDGRFIVLAEQGPGWFADKSPGLIFASDPVADGVELREFGFSAPGSYRPTDMAELPDGRIAILLRTWTIGAPPRFPSKLAIADPAEIRPGKIWRPRVIADLTGPIPSDNYEGIAVEPMPGGGATVWIISDDNNTTFQRTLLLKFAWNPATPTKKAPGSPGRLP